MTTSRGPDTLQKALEFAAQAHNGQKRKDRRAPYIVHPVAVVRLLASRMGVTDPTILSAAALHDVVEDTPRTLNEIRDTFGAGVGDLVGALTVPPDLHGDGVPEDRKTARLLADVASMPWAAVVIKLADRWDNLSDTLTVVQLGIWSADKLERFREQSLALLEAVESRRLRDPPPAKLRPALEAGLTGVQSVLDT